jgi:hypothetical protein
LHDSPTLQVKFKRLLEAQSDQYDNIGFTNQAKSLVQCVPTQWNTNLDCLTSHIKFETPIKQLMSDSSLGLNSYKLTDDQWQLAKKLIEVLEVSL